MSSKKVEKMVKTSSGELNTSPEEQSQPKRPIEMLGDRLQGLMKGKGLNQAQFAYNIGIGSPYLSDILRGKKPRIGGTIGKSLIKSICKFCNCEENWLLTGYGDMEYPSDSPQIKEVKINKTTPREKTDMLMKVIQQLERLKIDCEKFQIRIEKLESQCPGYQKKNQEVKGN